MFDKFVSGNSYNLDISFGNEYTYGGIQQDKNLSYKRCT